MDNSNPTIHCVKQGLDLHKDSKSHEKFQWDIYVALASQYSNNLSEETKKGLYEKAAQGHYPGNQKRGYRTIGDIGHKIWFVDSDSQDAKFIPIAFELYDSGNFTLKTISQKMFEQGWKSSVGKPISTSEMHNILRDCFYCGQFIWHDKKYEGKHTSLISKEMFYRVQDRLSRKLTGKYRKHTFLFNDGLLICGECGRYVTAELQRGHSYYHCTKHANNCSQKKYMREEKIEEQILQILNSLVIDNPKLLEWVRKALKENHTSETDYHMTTLKELEEQLLQVSKRLNTLYDDRVDGIINKEFYEEKRQQYEEQQQAILDAKENHVKANIDYMQLGINLFELSQKGPGLYSERALPEEKRELLNFLFLNIKLKDEKLIPTFQNGFEVIARHAKDQSWLGVVDDFRTFD